MWRKIVLRIYCVFAILLSIDSSAMAQEAIDFATLTWEKRKKGQSITSIAIAPSGKNCLLGLSNGEICLCDLATRKVLVSKKIHPDVVDSIDLSSDESFFYSGCRNGDLIKSTLGADTVKSVKVWKSPNGKFISKLSLLSDGELLAGSYRSILKLSSNGKLTTLLRGSLRTFGVSSDGSAVAINDGPYRVKLIATSDFSVLGELELPSKNADGSPLPGNIRGIEFSPDDRYLLLTATIKNGSQCIEFDLKDFSKRTLDVCMNGRRHSAKYSPCGNYASLIGFDLSVFNLRTGAKVVHLDSPTDLLRPKNSEYFSSSSFFQNGEAKLLAGTVQGEIYEIEFQQRNVVPIKSNKNELAWFIGHLMLRSSPIAEEFEIPEDRRKFLQQIEEVTLVGGGSEVVNVDFPHFNQLKVSIEGTKWVVDFSTQKTIETDKNQNTILDSFKQAKIGGIKIWRRLPSGSIDVVVRKIPKRLSDEPRQE